MTKFFSNKFTVKVAAPRRFRALTFLALSLFLTGCTGSSLTSFGSSSNLGPTGTECVRKSDPNAFDQTVAVWICKWQKPAGAGATSLTYIGHVDSNLDKLWDTTSFTTPNTSYEVTVPVSGGPYFFAVSAQKGTKVYHDYNYVVLQEEGSGNVVSFAGIKDVAAASTNYYTARWDTCTDLVTHLPLNCVYSVFRVVNGDTRQLFLIGTTVDKSMRIQTSGQPGEQFLVRARETGQNDSNAVLLGDTLKFGQVFPSFEGVKLAKVASGPNGLTKGKLSWNPVDDISQIRGYQIFYSTTRGLPAGTALQGGNPSSWGAITPANFSQMTGSNLQSSLSLIPPVSGSSGGVPWTTGVLVDRSLTEVDVTGLLNDTTYYFTVRAISLSSPPVVELNRVDREFKTKANVITQGFAGVSSVDQATGDNYEAFSQLNVVWASPDWDKPGVADRFKITYQQVSNCDDPFTGVVGQTFVAYALDPTLTSLPITGLATNSLVKVMVQAQLGLGGPVSNTTNYLCRRVVSDPPIFAGARSASPSYIPDATSGFNNLDISFIPATGNWSSYEITATPVAGSDPVACPLPDVQSYARTTNPTSPLLLPGLNPLCTYRIKMTAKYVCPNGNANCPVGGVTIISGDTAANSGVDGTTEPVHPDGNAQVASADTETTGRVTYSTPAFALPPPLYNEFVVYHEEGPTARVLLEDSITGRPALKATPDFVVSVPLGSTQPSIRTFIHPTSLTPNTQHCWVVQPRFGGSISPPWPLLWSKSPITAACKQFKVESVVNFTGAITARRTPNANGFRQVKITYRRPAADEPGAANHVFAEATCSTSPNQSSFKTCYGYSKTDLASCKGPGNVDWSTFVARDSAIGPAAPGVTEIRELTLGNGLDASIVPEGVALYCIVASVNDRGLSSNPAQSVQMWNAGNGELGNPVKKTTGAFPYVPGNKVATVGQTDVRVASSTSIKVTVKLPTSIPDTDGGGLFSHVAIALMRSRPEPTIANAENYYNNLMSDLSLPGNMVMVNGRPVLSTKLQDGSTSTGLFQTIYDVLDGVNFAFPGDATLNSPDRAIVRFRFQGALGNFARLDPVINKEVDFTINNLASNYTICALGKAIYMSDNYPGTGITEGPYSHYLENVANTGKCATPSAVAPEYPTAVDDGSYTTPNVAGVILKSNGTLFKPDTSGGISQAFDFLQVNLPAVTTDLTECNGMEVAIFDAGTEASPILPPSPTISESPSMFAARIFAATPVANRIEKTVNPIYPCRAAPSLEVFPLVDLDGQNGALQMYHRYYAVSHAYKSASPNLSHGALLFSAATEIRPDLPHDTLMLNARLNDSAMPACANANSTNCYDATLPARAVGAKYSAKLSWTAPIEADQLYPYYLNRVYIWRNSSSGVEATLRTTVYNRSVTKTDLTGPTSCPDIVIKRDPSDLSTSPPAGCSSTVILANDSRFSDSGGAMSYLDAGVTADLGGTGRTCYNIATVYADSAGRYLPSTGTATETGNGYTMCVNPTYSPPSGSSFGVSFISENGTCNSGAGNLSDGTTKLRFTVYTGSLATTSIDQFYIYYSPTAPAGYPTSTQPQIDAAFRTSEPPWAVINRGDSTFDAVTTDGFIEYGCGGKTVNSGYFHVRTFYGPASATVINTKANYYSMASNKANYVFIPKTATKLSYDFYMMSMEAAVDNYGNLSNDAVHLETPPTTNLLGCNANFHNFSLNGASAGWVPASNNCGTSFQSTAKAVSRPGVTPQALKWAQAWATCRNASTDDFRVRMPTQEEWSRATKWASDQYSTLYNSGNGQFYQNGCRFTGGVRTTGANTACQNYLGVLDAAGNMREWVDARMKQQSMAAFIRTYGYTENMTTIGRMADNGIDRLTPIFHLVNPGDDGGMALLMGSGVVSNSPFTAQKDSGTESWQDLATNNLVADMGFRCIAFSRHSQPSALDLELPQESRYTNDSNNAQLGDLPGNTVALAKKIRVPTNRYLRTSSNSDNFGDYRVERISLPASNQSNGGAVTIRWAPWEKSCGACADNFKYHIYRMQEPAKKDERFNPIWAVAGTRYSTPLPLDPLSVNSGLSDTWTAITAPLYPNGLPASGAGSVCSAPDTTNGPYRCAYTDNQSPAEAKTLWLYVIVAEDDRGNKSVASIQRFRTPHLTGQAPRWISPDIRFSTFRKEIRHRRVGLAILDPNFSSNLLFQSVPQHMARVSMEYSGLDHDYYIQKYEASISSGVIVPYTSDQNDSPMSTVSGSNTWAPDMAVCLERLRRDNVLDSACGNASPTIAYQSIPSGVPTAIGGWGSRIKGCLNSAVEDGDGAHNRYPLAPVSQSEMYTAGQWGDLNLDGIVDHNPFLTTAIEGSDLRTYEKLDANCFATVQGNTGDKAGCISMHGVYDLNGNYQDISADRLYTEVGVDNGIDGISFGQSNLNDTGFSVLIGGGRQNLMDLFRGMYPAGGVGAIVYSPQVDMPPYYGDAVTTGLAAYSNGGLGYIGATYLGNYFQQALDTRLVGNTYYTARCGF